MYIVLEKYGILWDYLLFAELLDVCIRVSRFFVSYIIYDRVEKVKIVLC